MEDYESKYEVSGQMQSGALGVVVTLALVVGLATIVTVATQTLAGQFYQASETSIDAITNDTIKGYVQTAIGSSFSAGNQAISFQPLLYLSVIMGVIITVIVMSFQGAGTGSAGAL